MTYPLNAVLPNATPQTAPLILARLLLATLDRDLPRLKRIDHYLHGQHDDPYLPVNADDEYRMLAERCISNWMPLLVATPAEAMYVDTFRRGASVAVASESDTPEWDHWEQSRLGARQLAVHRGALTYGHSFTVTEKVKGKILTRGLSALKTVALYEDPANDQVPYAVLTVTRWPVTTTMDGKSTVQAGSAQMWDGRRVYAVSFEGLSDKDKVRVDKGKRHGSSECPVTRFAAAVDLEGRTLGVIEPMIALQNRINQTVFDLLVAQTYASTMVRTVTGMAPPLKRDADGELILDDDGQPIPLDINVNARRFLFAEDPEVNFGSLQASPLNGFIDSIDMSIRHLAAISQTPPHHLLGQIANLSAEALQAAETALTRKIQEFQATFGESWERVFRLAAELAGDLATSEDYSGEVIWRDMESKSLAQAADALGKLSQQLQIPAQGLWKRVPDATQAEVEEWKRMAKEQDSALQMQDALTRAGQLRQQPAQPGAQPGVANASTAPKPVATTTKAPLA